MNRMKPLVTLLTVTLIGFLSVGIVGFHTLKASLVESKKQDVAAILNIARNQSARYVEQYEQGILTKQQADEKIIHYLSSLRYGSSYVWANDDNGIARVHPRQEIIGQFQKSYPHHIAHLTDDNIYYLTKRNVKPVTNRIIEKTNGVVKLSSWNWVIGFGLYMDDVDKIIIDSMKSFITIIMVSILMALLVTNYWLKKAK